MKPSSLAVLLTALAATGLPCGLLGQGGPAADASRADAAAVIAFGRLDALPKGPAAPSGARSPGIADLLVGHRRELQSDPSLARSVVEKAYADTLGRAPTEPERSAARTTTPTYFELSAALRQNLEKSPADYAALIRRAYRRVVGREPYDLELAYWAGHDVLPFDLLLAVLQNWARRNQPGLMVTSGTAIVSPNSDYLLAVPLSPSLAAEARVALGRTDPVAPAAGRNLIAPGGSQLVTEGHIPFVAAGSGLLAELSENRP